MKVLKWGLGGPELGLTLHRARSRSASFLLFNMRIIQKCDSVFFVFLSRGTETAALMSQDVQRDKQNHVLLR